MRFDIMVLSPLASTAEVEPAVAVVAVAAVDAVAAVLSVADGEVDEAFWLCAKWR